MLQVYKTAYLEPIFQIENVYEDTAQAMSMKFSKKYPVNMANSEEHMSVNNGKIVDIEWKILHCLSSKTLNKLFVPRF